MESWELGGTLDVVDIRLLLACLALVFSSIAMGSMMIEIEKDKDRGEQLSVGLALRLRLLCSFFWDSDCDDVMIGKDFKKKVARQRDVEGMGALPPLRPTVEAIAKCGKNVHKSPLETHSVRSANTSDTRIM